MKTVNKKLTFKYFNYKWGRVPTWARATDHIYEQWYLTRYGYKNHAGLKKFLKDKKSILEAGCGVGRDAKMFAEANPDARIVGVDQSEEALRIAKKSLKTFPGWSELRADITTFKTKEKFDFISCDQVVHHTPNPGKTLSNLGGKLNPGGILNFSVCRKKNEYRDLVDDLIMLKARDMKPEDLWGFSRVVTEFAKALYELDIKPVKFKGRKYESLQRFVHNQVFRAWYDPKIAFELSVSSNYDWFSSNPRFTATEVKTDILSHIEGFKILRFHEDDAVISVSLKKLA